MFVNTLLWSDHQVAMVTDVVANPWSDGVADDHGKHLNVFILVLY